MNKVLRLYPHWLGKENQPRYKVIMIEDHEDTWFVSPFINVAAAESVMLEPSSPWVENEL